MSMKNNINLIRDRAERPRTAMEKLSFTIPLALFVAYAVTLGLALIVVQSLSREAELLENQIENVRAQHEPARHMRENLDDNVAYDINKLKDAVRLYENRWVWSEKLKILEENIPEEVFLTALTGQAGERLQIRGHAKDHDAMGVERVRNIIVALENNPQFTRTIREVNWQSSRTVERDDENEWSRVLEFNIMCPAAEE